MFSWLWFGSTSIQSDEVVEFYPTFASYDADQSVWKVGIHGAIFEPENDSLKRASLIALLRTTLGVSKNSRDSELLTERLHRFMVDNERGKKISIRLGNGVHQLAASAPNGHFFGNVQLASREADRLTAGQPRAARWLSYEAVTDDGDHRRFAGRVQLIDDTGVSIISDIDDTVKDTQVTNRRAMLTNTFMREFRAVPGMAPIYRQVADRGVAIHFVSGSPWQLYEPLAAFFARQNFPAGTFHLKNFRLTDSTLFDLFATHEASKSQAIGQLLGAFPRRRFILIGDSGEQDPEIYGKIARRHRDRVIGIFIRNVNGEGADSLRLRTAFAEIDADVWQLFADASEIKPRLLELSAQEVKRSERASTAR